ncbi:MAG: DUF4115 domain-containing protein [Acidobacteriota bacterium]|nr:DUF4115 domain-containing protein [Acidobacteriota bacterium]
MDGDSITYTLPAGTPVQIAIKAPCWVQVRTSATAPVSQETILAAGQSITVDTPLWIRFGDPTNATATAGGFPLQLPVLSGQLIVVSPAA